MFEMPFLQPYILKLQILPPTIPDPLILHISLQRIELELLLVFRVEGFLDDLLPIDEDLLLGLFALEGDEDGGFVDFVGLVLALAEFALLREQVYVGLFLEGYGVDC